MYDLLQTIEYGGCSAKLSAETLEELLKKLSGLGTKKNTNQGTNFLDENKNMSLLVGNDTSDDAAVYKLNEEQAIIFTTDFFPPVCSDPYTFGQIAATNALSDVYAMGGKVLMALNIIMFPAQKIPLEALAEILKGGQDKVLEAEALIVGGHTIEDYPPKYGLAVIGLIHPDKIITNAAAKVGDVIILTKPLGIGTILAGQRLDLVSVEHYQKALEMMKQLNKEAAVLMNKYDIKCATDITGFGLLGHLKKMAKASGVCISIDIEKVPFQAGALDLIKTGCIPGAAFRNKEYVKLDEVGHSEIKIKSYGKSISKTHYNETMLLYDPQTSGGMAICVPAEKEKNMLEELKKYYPESAVIGKVEEI
ncbi:MAG: selenide, water dikinase SelD [Candidatus Cloacimonetes bacterium]|nr:selenide, water dikinase SelD [Candidatus Cloacimonadota bacterium]